MDISASIHADVRDSATARIVQVSTFLSQSIKGVTPSELFSRYLSHQETPYSRPLIRPNYRYYQPSDVPTNINHDGTTVRPTSSHDASLTAFAQLGALRLNAKRAVISLCTRNTEYIIAEARKTLSLQEDSRHDKNDGLWQGVGEVHDKTSITLALFKSFYNTSPNQIAVAPYVVVKDLSQDDRFKDQAFVKGAPFDRFIACFPLRTPLGFVISTYNVIDDRPRDGLSDPEVGFLSDMSVTVIDHLEAGRIKQKHFRAESMVKAIRLFLEGKSSLRDWWLSGGHNVQQSKVNNDLRNGVTISRQADIEFGVQDPMDTYSIHGMQSLHDKEGNDTYSESLITSSMPRSPFTNKRPQMRRGHSLQSSTPGTVPSILVLTSEQEHVKSDGALESILDKPQEPASTPWSTLSDSIPETKSHNVTTGKRL
jgi:hypothetical protein